MRFSGTFRRYQADILSVIGEGRNDRKHHLVAPPGAGKTVIGLELIRRFDRPAVVFAPTTTIVGQWLTQLRAFTDAADTVGSADAAALSPVNVFTYQLISTPDRADDELRALARSAWVADLVTSSEADEQGAIRRLDAMQAKNRASYELEIAKRTTTARHELLQADPASIYQHLHANARDLIDTLASAGIGTVVLDECHHLLDYWAIVLRALIGRLDAPSVVGLTATLPDPDNQQEFENYTSLLGDVDYEIPTPAVIKEGDLAPFRDLAWFVRPTEREVGWLQSVAASFEAAVSSITGSPVFTDWLRILLPVDGTAGAGLPPEGAPWSRAGGWPLASADWREWALDHPGPAEAIVAAAYASGLQVPAVASVFERREGGRSLRLEDLLILLERFGLDQLKLSAEREDHAMLAMLRRAVAPFGLTLTERGLRQGRSIVDLTMSMSEAKSLATADILARESAALGQRLRAAVIADFERQSAGPARSASPLERDAGSAFRAFEILAGDDRTRPLHPVLLTGSTVRTTTEFAEALRARLEAMAVAERLELGIVLQPHGGGITELVGTGHHWRPGFYVRLVTAAFVDGDTRVLAGTRGLLGEGWDAPALNTLVNLTSVTTPTSTAQLHGRALRLDPAWPDKVAHVYDVVCLWQDYPLGGGDLDRLTRRHDAFLGIVPPGDRRSGEVVRGLGHVDPDIPRRLLEVMVVSAPFMDATDAWRKLDLDALNQRTARAVDERSLVRALWHIGEPYDNQETWFTELRIDNSAFKTAATVAGTLSSILKRLTPGPILIAIGLRFAAFAGGSDLAIPIGLIAAGVAAIVLNARPAFTAVRALLSEQPPDAIVGDAARAVLQGLQEAGQISGRFSPADVALDQNLDGSVRISLRVRDAPADTLLFVRSLNEVFGSPEAARYLIRRDDGRLPNVALRVLWAPIRAWLAARGRVRPAYHPVPSVLGANRESADIFAHAWARWVGGGQLVLGHSREGRELRAQVHREQRPLGTTALTQRWR